MNTADPSSMAERLKVRLKECPDTGCHEWQGWRNEKGYGRVNLWVAGVRTVAFVHRLAWEIHNGRSLEPGEIVMHRCDNPKCANPEHLMLGTLVENVKDMHDKGRAAKVPKKNRLSESEVVAIKLRLSKGHGPDVIALSYPCGASTIRHIKAGTTWRHVPVPPHPLEGYDPLKDYDNKEAMVG